jgi:leucyl-tRNA synthetase
VPKDASRETVQDAATDNPAVQKFLEGKVPKKIVVVPGRLVNLVI